MRRSKPVLALTGSIGTGKSSVAKFFAKKGHRVLDADKIAKSLYQTDSGLLEALRRTFGEQVLSEEGVLNRERLSSMVFGDKASLAILMDLMKEYLLRELTRLLDEMSEEEARPFVVLEAPVLFEYGFEAFADVIVLVRASEDQIVERVMQRNGMSREEVLARLRSQLSQEEKEARSDFCIDNSGSFETLQERMEELYVDLLRRFR